MPADAAFCSECGAGLQPESSGNQNSDEEVEQSNVLEKYDDKWYEHDGSETNYAVTLKDGSKKYYKQLGWVENRLRDEYGIRETDGDESEAARPDITEVVDRAQGGSVTEDRLQSKEAFGTDRLNEAPIFHHLKDGEQPHFIFVGLKTGLKLIDPITEQLSPSSNYHAFLVITDQRIVVLTGTKDVDREISIPYNEVAEFNVSTSFLKIKVRFKTKSATFEFLGKKEGKAQPEAAATFVNQHIPQDAETLTPESDPTIQQLLSTTEKVTAAPKGEGRVHTFKREMEITFTRFPGISQSHSTKRNVLIGGIYMILFSGLLTAVLGDPPDSENRTGGDDDGDGESIFGTNQDDDETEETSPEDVVAGWLSNHKSTEAEAIEDMFEGLFAYDDGDYSRAIYHLQLSFEEFQDLEEAARSKADEHDPDSEERDLFGYVIRVYEGWLEVTGSAYLAVRARNDGDHAEANSWWAEHDDWLQVTADRIDQLDANLPEYDYQVEEIIG